MEARSDNVVRIGELELRFLVDENQGTDNLVMFEFTVPPEARVPAPHFHREVDEAAYGLAGTFTMTIDGEKRELRAGETIFIPRGTVHHHENRHAETARALVVLTPGSISKRYFEEMADAINVAGKPDIEKVKSIMLAHGLVPA
ncbi:MULTISPECIES: cupin domain-containing protein [unclassified Chelatococcus]|uniref:cupin domain-containing protein n=1 Tax=unclassified Chelatococcus TaxID=2638111 RepID=UPI001BD0AABE|nr:MULTISPECIES: cupin domain-containing protein [unclassified Chelatococcus]MBS7696153.1 cupin domain-containing protein [Chelatococcus sp. YT9]MBX3557820.1 cupin domain-containing protein [Chelatococcus sp.]